MITADIIVGLYQRWCFADHSWLLGLMSSCLIVFSPLRSFYSEQLSKVVLGRNCLVGVDVAPLEWHFYRSFVPIVRSPLE